MLGERGDRTGTQIRGRAHVENEAALDDLGQHRGILNRADAVADPVRVEREHLPHRLGAGRLARVRNEAEAAVARDVERLAVRLERPALDTPDAEPDDPAV